jgi:hypothetical protein
MNTTINTRRDALCWLIDNRRSDISLCAALKTLRLILHDDPEAQTLLSEIETAS